MSPYLSLFIESRYFSVSSSIYFKKNISLFIRLGQTFAWILNLFFSILVMEKLLHSVNQYYSRSLVESYPLRNASHRRKLCSTKNFNLPSYVAGLIGNSMSYLHVFQKKFVNPHPMNPCLEPSQVCNNSFLFNDLANTSAKLIFTCLNLSG